MATAWKKQWNSYIAKTRYPGVYRRRDGGHLVRAFVRLPSGERSEIKETHVDTQTDGEANERLVTTKRLLMEACQQSPSSSPTVDPSPQSTTALALAARAPEGTVESPSTSLSTSLSTTPVTVQVLEQVLERHSKRVTGVSFRKFARDEQKKRKVSGNNATSASQDKFEDVIDHLVDGTTVRDKSSKDVIIHCAGLGDHQLEEVTAAVLRDWKLHVAEALIQPEHYAPTTINGWITTLKSVMKQATYVYTLPRNEADSLTPFPTDNHSTYTRANPNALTPGQAYHFVRLLRISYPQHYAMTYLGLFTGLRHCNLRPLRRRGPEADLNLQTGRLYVARSQTRKQIVDAQVRERTKQGTKYYVQLPPPVLDVLEWHIKTQLMTAPMQRSDLLLPSVRGGFKSPNVLDKPFAAISKRMKLGFALTPKGLRRTFNDLARRAKIDRSVTRSISGHLTEQMQELYETVGEDETCVAVGRMVALVDGQPKPGPRRGRQLDTVPLGNNRLETVVAELTQLITTLMAGGGLDEDAEDEDASAADSAADDSAASDLAEEGPIAAE